MKPKVLDEATVKKMYGINSFRNPGKNVLIRFANNLVNMDREVAIKCIEQFPNFSEAATTIVGQFYKLCEKSIESDGSESIAAYRKILDDLSVQLDKSEDLEERRYLIATIVDVGQNIERVEDKKRAFKEGVIKICSVVGLVVTAALAASLGTKIDTQKLIQESMKEDSEQPN